MNEKNVSFRWADRESRQERITNLTGEESKPPGAGLGWTATQEPPRRGSDSVRRNPNQFLQRFLQHVLPRGFTRVRHYGWLSPAAWARYARVRQLLRAGDVVLHPPDKAEILCPCCGHVMIFFHALRTRARPPPLPPPPPASSSAIAIPA